MPVCIPRSTACLMKRSDSGAFAAMRAAIANAVDSSASGATTSVTRPIRAACAASMWSQVSISCFAHPGPIRRGRRWVPPAAGNAPIFASGSPSRAVVDAMRMSAHSASSRPPPSATPLIAAITGFSNVSIARNRSCVAFCFRW